MNTWYKSRPWSATTETNPQMFAVAPVIDFLTYTYVTKMNLDIIASVYVHVYIYVQESPLQYSSPKLRSKTLLHGIHGAILKWFIKLFQLIRICNVQSCFHMPMTKIQQYLRWTAAILDTENSFLILGPQ